MKVVAIVQARVGSSRFPGKILEREFSDADQKRLLASLEKDIPTLLR